MPVTAIHSEIKHGRLRIFVTATKGSHHSTLVKEVRKHIREQPKPDYDDNPGKWSYARFDGYWQPVGKDAFTSTALYKTFTCWPVPADSEAGE